MTGRPEAPLPENGPGVPLARRMRELKKASAMSYQQMAELAKYTAPALSTAANGKKLPPLPRVLAYVDALGADEKVRDEITQLWTEARDEFKRAKASARRSRPAPAFSPAEYAKGRAAEGELRLLIPFAANDAEQTSFEWSRPWPEPANTPYFSADPAAVETFEEFSVALAQILSESGRTVVEVIRDSSMPASADGERVVQLKKTTVYDVLNGKARPSPSFTQVFLHTCGMPADRVDAWVARLRHIQQAAIWLEEMSRNRGLEEMSRQSGSGQHDVAQIRLTRWGKTDDVTLATGNQHLVAPGETDDFVVASTGSHTHAASGEITAFREGIPSFKELDEWAADMARNGESIWPLAQLRPATPPPQPQDETSHLKFALVATVAAAIVVLLMAALLVYSQMD